MIRRIISIMEGQATSSLYEKHKGALKEAVDGQVVTRFPPEPSGYLHIGHTKAMMLNFHYAKMYNGRMLLRFDDTNPSKENQDFVENIMQDLRTLEIYPDSCSHTSDWFETISQYMRKLIESGNAYMDNTPVEEMRQMRTEGIPSRCRDVSIEENLQIWDDFFQGNLPEYCARGKISVDNKNKCMRDPVFYRYNATPHLRTGDKWKVYPTYDLACPIVDSLEGVTHALRTSEYNDRNPMYYWILEKLGLRKVTINDFSKLSFVNTVLSKRKLQKLVDTGVVEGWNDPRFPTVQGIMRRGMTVQALKEFMLEQGHSKRTVLMDWTSIWAKNKQVIDPIVPRYTALSTESLCLLNLTNGPAEPYQEMHPLHPKNTEVGESPYWYANQVLVEYNDANSMVAGEKVTLMRWGNAIVESIEPGQGEFKGHPVKLILNGRLVLEDKDFKGTKKLNWLPALEILSSFAMNEYDVLITKAKPEDADEIENIINVDSKFVTHGLGLPTLKELAVGTLLQFERRGYYIVDQKGENTVFINVPDGKTKAASVLDSKVDKNSVAKGSDQPMSKKQQAKLNKKAKKEEAKKKAEESKIEDSKTEESKTEEKAD